MTALPIAPPDPTPARLARRVAPDRCAHERVLPLPAAVASIAPGGLARGSVVVVSGPVGAGATSLALQFAAAATVAGEWAAVVDPDGSLGGLTLLAAGVAPERCAVVRSVDPARWVAVVGILLDGITSVIATPPAHLRAADARRLVARARERRSILTLLAWDTGRGATVWPAETTLRCTVETVAWHGLHPGGGLLDHRDLTVSTDGRGRHGRPAHHALQLAG